MTLMAIAFFCARTPANWSRENRARRLTGTRMLVQAARLAMGGAVDRRARPVRPRRPARPASAPREVADRRGDPARLRLLLVGTRQQTPQAAPTLYRVLIPGAALAACAGTPPRGPGHHDHPGPPRVLRAHQNRLHRPPARPAFDRQLCRSHLSFGQRQIKRRADALLRFRPHAPAVPLHHPPHEREANTLTRPPHCRAAAETR